MPRKRGRSIMSTSSRNAIVIEGAHGIGAAISERLAAHGVNVVFSYAVESEEVDRLITRIAQAGGYAVGARADVGDPAALVRMFDATELAFGGVDILVTSAGTLECAAIASAHDSHFERLVSINLRAVFYELREAANRIRSGGRIINFSSSAAGLYQPGYAIYAAMKAAVEAMTKVMAKEMLARGITVNAIASGPTALTLPTSRREDAVAHGERAASFEKSVLAQDVARIVAFLAGSQGAAVSGQILKVDEDLLAHEAGETRLGALDR
ncbi:SDR family oxidoreductase [Rhizobium johnstonii]|uniref:SDR family oxidoreductase n=1 Tax=Rhizobium johnstonii TaxID=3019933 RepID=UPI003F966040